MKKIFYILIGLIIITVFVLIFTFSKENKQKNMTTIKVAEVTNSAFYTPFYVAIKNNYFKDNNIDIDLILTSGANNVIAAVLSKDVDIGLCGPEATIYVYNEGEKDYVKTFAGLTKRDGQFIVSRVKNDNFKLEDLIGKEVLGGRPGGMPIINFYNALKNGNIEGVNTNDTVDFANLTSAFLSGTGDFVNLFEPNATKIEKMNKGYVVASVGEECGEVPFTCFMAMRSYIDKNEGQIEAFLRAVMKGYNYLMNATDDEIYEALAPSFSTSTRSSIVTSVQTYKRIDAWMSSPAMEESAYNRLLAIMTNAGELDKNVDFSKVVDNSYANRVMSA